MKKLFKFKRKRHNANNKNDIIFNKRHNANNKNDIIFNNRSQTSEVKSFTIPYHPPLIPASEEQFLTSINEFICLQYFCCNTYSGKKILRELICSEKPELKKKFLRFLEEHPIKLLLDGDRYSKAFDVDTWEIRFIFDNADLNKTICGYGRTELTAPYLREVGEDTCDILSPSEDLKRRMQIEVFKSQISEIEQEAASKNAQENK